LTFISFAKFPLHLIRGVVFLHYFFLFCNAQKKKEVTKKEKSTNC